MTPQTKARRTAMIEQIITDTALDYRFDDKGQPRTTDTMKAALDDYIADWNRAADPIDKWAAPKFPDGFIGLRLGWSDALSCKFNLTKGAIRAGAKLPATYWHALGVLDDLAEHVAKGKTKLTVKADTIRWMADSIFLSLIPPALLDRAAYGKGHIWDRRLRHQKRAKGRRSQAYYAEASLVAEDARLEADFQSLLRETIRQDGKLRRDVRLDHNKADFGFSTAPPEVKVVRFIDRNGVEGKGFMLVPLRVAKPKRPPKESGPGPQKTLLGIIPELGHLSPADAALELNQRGIPGPVNERWTAEAVASIRMLPKKTAEL